MGLFAAGLVIARGFTLWTSAKSGERVLYNPSAWELS